jgi:uncharacterized protein (DUF885 family)
MKRLLLTVITATSLVVPGCSDGVGERSKLYELFEREWEARLADDPLLAMYVGDHRFGDRLPSVGVEDLSRQAERDREFLEELERIDLERLGEDDRINAMILERQLRDRIAGFDFGAYQIPLNADSGFHTAFARLPNEMPFVTVADYESYIARLRGFPDYVDQHVANMRAGLERGFTLPRVVLDGIQVGFESHVVRDASESLFYAPFERFPTTVAHTEHPRLRDAARAAIMEGVVPGYRKLLQFMLDEYIPGARESIGASELPRGREYYAQRVNYFTTLNLTPEEIHEIGVAEVARIHGEMLQVIDRVGFDGSFAEFLEFLRTDPRFYAQTPQELLERASFIAKKMDGKLPSLFKTLPRLPYGVAPVPDHLAPKYTAGRYVSPAMGSKQPGYYWVNTYRLEMRPLYALEALTLHEAVPGHHLQGALATEQAQQPPFRRFDYISAYGEGWGLYSEWLGLEAGFYADPYSEFGRLTYEMWRACRLVVDTGLHAMGWTRDRAMDYLASNTALSLHEVRTETDRYISWPGQALAYKIGELKIRQLRREAEQALGEGFDVREFHDVVLLSGSVPLPVLEEQVRRYLDRQSQEGP